MRVSQLDARAAVRDAEAAAIRALQAIAVDWAAHPEAHTLAELKQVVNDDRETARRVARAEHALARLIALAAMCPVSDAACSTEQWWDVDGPSERSVTPVVTATPKEL